MRLAILLSRDDRVALRCFCHFERSGFLSFRAEPGGRSREICTSTRSLHAACGLGRDDRVALRSVEMTEGDAALLLSFRAERLFVISSGARRAKSRNLLLPKRINRIGTHCTQRHKHHYGKRKQTNGRKSHSKLNSGNTHLLHKTLLPPHNGEPAQRRRKSKCNKQPYRVCSDTFPHQRSTVCPINLPDGKIAPAVL